MKGKGLTVSFLKSKESPPKVSSTTEKTASEVKIPTEIPTTEVKEEETRTPESVDFFHTGKTSQFDKTLQAELEMETTRLGERATAPRISPASSVSTCELYIGFLP
jgi:hypothetical protein